LAAERRRLLVTGSQDWDDWGAIRRPLKKLWDFDPDILLVSGGCPRGSDLLCETFWDEYLGGGTERHPADWYASGSFDRAAGFRRSEKMVRLGAWGCLAFGLPCERQDCARRSPDPGWPFHVTHGTGHCARYAEASGIPVQRYTPIPVA
jgi:YspA, cpYpsA-related SLOG family